MSIKNRIDSKFFNYREFDCRVRCDTELTERFLEVSNALKGLSQPQILSVLQNLVNESSAKHDRFAQGLLVFVLTHEGEEEFYLGLLRGISGIDVVLHTLSKIVSEHFHIIKPSVFSVVVIVLDSLISRRVSKVEPLFKLLLRSFSSCDYSAFNYEVGDRILILLQKHFEWLKSNRDLSLFTLYSLVRFGASLAFADMKDHVGGLLYSRIGSLAHELFKDVISSIPVTASSNESSISDLGRDFVLLLNTANSGLNLSDCPFSPLHTDLCAKRKSLTKTLMFHRTKTAYIVSSLPSRLERQLIFLFNSVKNGKQKRYQSWLASQWLNVVGNPESGEHMALLMIRYIVSAFHPPPSHELRGYVARYVVLGWLVLLKNTQVILHSLFLDWIYFNFEDGDEDSILSLEPTAKLMFSSLARFPRITNSLLRFLLGHVDTLPAPLRTVAIASIVSAMRGLSSGSQPLVTKIMWNELASDERIEANLRMKYVELLRAFVEGVTHPQPIVLPIPTKNEMIFEMEIDNNEDLHKQKPPTRPQSHPKTDTATRNKSTASLTSTRISSPVELSKLLWKIVDEGNSSNDDDDEEGGGGIGLIRNYCAQIAEIEEGEEEREVLGNQGGADIVLDCEFLLSASSSKSPSQTLILAKSIAFAIQKHEKTAAKRRRFFSFVVSSLSPHFPLLSAELLFHFVVATNSFPRMDSWFFSMMYRGNFSEYEEEDHVDVDDNASISNAISSLIHRRARDSSVNQSDKAISLLELDVQVIVTCSHLLKSKSPLGSRFLPNLIRCLSISFPHSISDLSFLQTLFESLTALDGIECWKSGGGHKMFELASTAQLISSSIKWSSLAQISLLDMLEIEWESEEEGVIGVNVMREVMKILNSMFEFLALNPPPKDSIVLSRLRVNLSRIMRFFCVHMCSIYRLASLERNCALYPKKTMLVGGGVGGGVGGIHSSLSEDECEYCSSISLISSLVSIGGGGGGGGGEVLEEISYLSIKSLLGSWIRLGKNDELIANVVLNAMKAVKEDVKRGGGGGGGGSGGGARAGERVKRMANVVKEICGKLSQNKAESKFLRSIRDLFVNEEGKSRNNDIDNGGVSGDNDDMDMDDPSQSSSHSVAPQEEEEEEEEEFSPDLEILDFDPSVLSRLENIDDEDEDEDDLDILSGSPKKRNKIEGVFH